jgi:hypothetical protein
MVFTGNNYDQNKIGQINLLDKKVYGEFGIALRTTRLFLPAVFTVNYNTMNKDYVYKIGLDFDFD